MSFEDILKKGNITLDDLRQFQEEYDRRFVDRKFTGFEKVRHTTLHLAKLLGKLSNYCEKMEHSEDCSSQQIEEEIIPDLMVYMLWLSREFKIEPDEAYFKRMIYNIERMYMKHSSEEEIKNLKNLLNK